VFDRDHVPVRPPLICPARTGRKETQAMNSKLKLALLGLILALVSAGATSASALAAEAPYWKVEGHRLKAGEAKHIIINNAPGKEFILHTAIKGKKAEIRCKSVGSSAATINGSEPTFDGKAEIRLFPRECGLYINFGEGFVEEKDCEVADIESTVLSGQLWYEEEKETEEEKIVVVFEPRELTEEKALIANVKIEELEVCEFANTYALEGAVAARVSPENAEAKVGELVFPVQPIINVWQPQTAEKLKLALKFGGSTATLQDESKLELESEEAFGAWSA
jgi:hypothetical protein